MGRPTFEYIFTNGFDIEKETIENFSERTKDFAEAINVLIEMMYLDKNVPEDVNSNEYAFHSNVFSDCCDLPNAFCAGRLLMTRGYYSEAQAHFRSLVEKLIKIRYFSKNKDRLEPYEKSMFPDLKEKMTDIEKEKIKIPSKNGKMKKLSIKDMFYAVTEEEGPYNFYSSISRYVHKNSVCSSLMLNKLLKGRSYFILVPEFNEELAKYIFNLQLFLLFGYLNFLPSFFDYNWEEKDQLLLRYKEIKKVLRSYIIQNEVVNSEYFEWCKSIRLIVAEKDYDWNC